MIEKGSLTHNRCYPITGPQRSAAYESTVKERIYRTHCVTLTRKPLVNENLPSWTNSVPPTDATASTLSDCCEDSNVLSNPSSKNGKNSLYSKESILKPLKQIWVNANLPCSNASRSSCLSGSQAMPNSSPRSLCPSSKP